MMTMKEYRKLIKEAEAHVRHIKDKQLKVVAFEKCLELLLKRYRG